MNAGVAPDIDELARIMKQSPKVMQGITEGEFTG
jgi:hypothetical protein